MLCGSPHWHGFASQVVGELEKGGVLSFLEAEQLRSLSDPRRTLSIAIALSKQNGIQVDFDKILHPSKPNAVGAELFELLSSLRPVFVTTNYDKWLDEVGPEKLSSDVKVGGDSEPVKGPNKRPKYYLPEHLSSALLAERGSVIHLHGSYTEPSSMVVSLKDYIKHYADPRVQAFLSAMFKNYTVLFVGYGLAELEVLDHIIRANESLRTENTESRHFLLYAYRSTETVQTQFIKHFFRDQCGVSVVPYCIDTKGHQEVIELFKVWAAELDVRDPTILDLQSHLDRCVASPSAVNREAALRLVRSRPALVSYFVNSLKDIVWFNDLDSSSFFKKENNPKLKFIESERGNMYQADGWPALRYLEQIVDLSQGEVAIRIAEIVREISLDAKKQDIDNWRTWWSLATIFSKLPLELITDPDLEMIRTWLSDYSESTFVGYELGTKLLPRLLDSSEPSNWRKAMFLADALSIARSSRE